MKTKTRNRTPRRILAVFLSILMLMSSFVFASPVVSEAYNINDRVTFNEKGYGISEFYSNLNHETVKYKSIYGEDYSTSTTSERAAGARLTVTIRSAAGARTTAIYNGDPKRTSPYYNSPDSPYYLDFNFASRDYTNKPNTTNGVYYGFFDKRLPNHSQPLINAEYSCDTFSGGKTIESSGSTGSSSGGLVISHYECWNWSVKRSRANSASNSTNGAVKSYEDYNYYETKYSYDWYDGKYWNGGPKYDYNNKFLTSYAVGPKIFHYVVDSTALYNKYKELYVGYNEGYYIGNPKDKLDKAMHAAEMVLNGKLDRTVVAPVADGGYGYQCICQELIDAILADLNSVKITVKFADILTTRSDPTEAATFNPISIPSDYTKDLNVSINVSDKYDASNVKLVVNDKYGVKLGEYTPTGNSGSKYNFNVPITGDISEIVATGFTVKEYTVSVPTSATGLTITNPGNHTVTYGDNFTFTVTKGAAYTQATPDVKVNDNDIAYVQSGNTYTYTISNITANKKVTIGNMPINTYKYTLPTGVSFKVSDAAGMNHSAITYGKDYSFVVSVNKAYTQTEPTVTLASGKTLEHVSTAPGADGSIDYTYKATNVTAHDTVQVAEMSKNTYSAVLPYDKTEEASYKVTNEKADGNNVVSGIVYGTDLTFGVALAEQYNRSKVVVKYNGSVLTPDEGGVYTIENVTKNIADGEIVVEGVELNHYYITLPLETETGFVIEVGEGLNAKSVLSRTDFNFKFFLDPAYSDSTPTIKVSRDGGDNYKVLTKADGKYTIENVLSDCIVVVEGVKKNTYTVKFVDEGGNVLEEKKGVEYGSDVKYTGDTPTKATEKVSETTDAAGNTVLVERKYKFIGWSADTSYVTSNMEVTPIFEVTEVTTTTPADGGESEVVVTKKTANILFISDEVIIHKETVEKGKGFSGWTEVPVKTSSNPYETYEFLGWDINKDGNVDYAAGESNAIADVQDDVTFVAVFKSNLPAQTVNFYNFDGSKLLYTASVKRGERANYGLSSIPSRTDKAYEYTFEGWSYDKYADETTVLDKIVVGENDITVYAAYSKEVINYTYKYINDGVVLQEGTYNFVDGNSTDYKYTGATPVRDSSKSTDYTFDGWLATTPSRYSTEYIATYAESVRNYDYALPETNGTFSVALDEAVGEKLPFGGELIFTVTLDEGYTQTAPVVKSNGETLEYEKSGDNSYVFTIVADGADADEIKAKLNDITVETAINHYDVAIGKADGADISSEGFNTEYNGEGTFTVTLKESHNQTAPVVAVSEGDRAVVTLVSADGDVYTYKVSEIKSNATITVTTKINEYKVVMVNYDGKDVFNGNVEHGKAPAYKNPTRPTDANGKYVFIGWDTNKDGKVDVTEIKNVTAPVTAKAVYKYDHEHTSNPADPDSVWELIKTDKATCTETGMKYYVCKHCGEVTKNVEIPARGHKWTAEGEGWIIVKAPTCTETGLKSRYCCNEETAEYKACNHKEENVVVPATGHHDSDGDYICDDCGVDLGHCSKCICHKGNVLSKILRYTCTLLTKIFHKPIKCCKDMDWYGDKISSIS